MANPMIRIHDTTTGEVIDRPMTDAEYKEHLNPTPAPNPWAELASGDE
jgi:hypothetical protein